MEYVEVVVKIPEIVKAKIDDNINACDLDIYDCVMIAVKNGTPLPKGHGRLIDISPYEQWFNPVVQYDDGDHIHQVYTKNIPTIIETDKENEQ